MSPAATRRRSVLRQLSMFTMRPEYEPRIAATPAISAVNRSGNIGVTIFNYETAVHVEDVEALTAELLALTGKATEHMPDDHIRKAIIGASLISVAQKLDGLPMPTLWKRGGIAGTIRHIAAKWL